MSITEQLHAGADAEGIPTRAAAARLIAEYGHWTAKPGWVETALTPWTNDDGRPCLSVDWDAALAWAREHGTYARAQRVLELAASLAGHGSVKLGEALTGLGPTDSAIVARALTQATAQA